MTTDRDESAGPVTAALVRQLSSHFLKGGRGKL